MPKALCSILTRIGAFIALGLLMLAAPAALQADPADVDAAARGVVRVVVISRDGERITPISHGTGFAVGAERVVTNAHVVAEVVADPRLSLGIVPSDGGEAVFARLVAVSQRNDLALLETTSPLHLAPLTIGGNPPADAGAVTAVGYPQNVDRAQGLALEDIFRGQPPVKSMGYLSGRRPSREFDTLLHTAPIARGSSGGPLLDECGRVIGVNSFGAIGGNSDAEFFFAVSTRELLPFLRDNKVAPRINAMPCRSLADLDQADQARSSQQRATAEAQAAAREQALAQRRDAARGAVGFQVIEERENLMALTFVLLLAALGAGGFAWLSHEFRVEHEPAADFDGSSDEDAPALPERPFATTTMVAGAICLAALIGAAGAWLARPEFSTIDDLAQEQLRLATGTQGRDPAPAGPARGSLVCTLDEARSRVTGEADFQLPLAWSETGCVNARTQYGLAGGRWSRVFVPESEETVSVNRFDPAAREFVTERYLLDHAAMAAAREARGEYAAPSCSPAPDGARNLGEMQAGLLAQLPAQPNERLVYSCEPAR